MRLTMVFLLLIVSSTLSISGCGNKGPLYLPQEEPVEQTGNLLLKNELIDTPYKP